MLVASVFLLSGGSVAFAAEESPASNVTIEVNTDTAEVTVPQLNADVCEFIFADAVNMITVTLLLGSLKPCLQAGVETTLVISSIGGDPAAAAAFYDLIPLYGDRSLMRVIGVGDVASSAVSMFLAGGKREIGKHATILVHEITFNFTGDIDMRQSDLNENSMSMRVNNDILIDLIAEETNIPREEVANYVDDHHVFTAEEAARLGFADKIFTAK